MPTQEIADTLEVSSNTVRVWRHIFEEQGVAGLGTVAKGRGRKRAASDDLVAEVVRLTLNESADGSPTRWTTRSLAQRLGISKDSVARIWAERGIAPWQAQQPRIDRLGFERALVEAIALYLDPPISVAVFSVRRLTVDDVSMDGGLRPREGPAGLLRQSQARSRIEATLSKMPEAAAVRGAPGAGAIVRLLEEIGAQEGEQADVHVLLLDTASDCAPVVAAWLAQRPTGRWYQHLSTSSAEWRESVGRWLQLTNQEPLGQQEPRTLRVLAEALAEWTARWVDGAEPFSWVADTGLPFWSPPAPALNESPASRPASSPTAATPTSPEAVAEKLRRAILHGELAPGEHVRQPQWAEQLGVSRTVLREAFKILAGQHLLRHDPQVGYFVAKLNAADMRQLYWLTAVVEEQVFRNIRWPTKSEIEGLDQRFAEHYGSFLVGDLTAAIDHWRGYIFHLFTLSSETFLVKEAIRLWETATPYRMIVFTTMLLQDPSGSEIAIARQNQISALHARDISGFIQSIIHDRLPAFERYATHAEIMAFFREIPEGRATK